MRAILALTALSVLAIVSVILVAVSPPASAAVSQQAQDPRYFSETGFRIDNDAFLSFFEHRGGVKTFGLPVSRSFTLDGFQVQIFQRKVMQQASDGSVRLLNLLDPGLMPATSINFSLFPAPDSALVQSTPPVTDSDYAARIAGFVGTNVPDQFEGMDVGFLRTFQNTVEMGEAFPEGGGNEGLLFLVNLEMWGAPTSKPAFDPNNHNFVYQRFQRGIMHYDATTGATEGLLLGDWFKSVLTGEGLPADLESEMAGSRYLRQYNNFEPDRSEPTG